MEISLLIPVCNHDIAALVNGMKSCLGVTPGFKEILVGDDGSTPENRQRYKSLEQEGIRVIVSEKNIGRAAIRNRLALEATGQWLLFIDADAMIPSTAEAYVTKWLPATGFAKVISGGVIYHKSLPPDPDKRLRWKYGSRREFKKASERNRRPYASFTTFNVLIENSVFTKLRFNEELKQYGHEDTLFSYQLKKAGIPVLHIDNGLVHEGLESNREYINKTKQGIENLSKLYDSVTDIKSFSELVWMLRIYNRLKIFRLTLILAGIFIRFRERMEIRIDTPDPSLFLFALYKVSLFCTYREIHRRRKVMPAFVL